QKTFHTAQFVVVAPGGRLLGGRRAKHSGARSSTERRCSPSEALLSHPAGGGVRGSGRDWTSGLLGSKWRGDCPVPEDDIWSCTGPQRIAAGRWVAATRRTRRYPRLCGSVLRIGLAADSVCGRSLCG